MSERVSTRVPVLVTGGDPRHGVVRLARELAAGVQTVTGTDHAAAQPPPNGAVHVHFTDRLWGSTPEQATRALTAIGRRQTLTVTLHDVPQPSDGAERVGRRADCYRAVARASAGIVCSSHHEVALLHALTVLPAQPPPAVIPLPITPGGADGAAITDGQTREVALLGYIYPGKGHAEAIEAVAGARPEITVSALGAPAAGHEAELVALAELAGRHHVPFAVTGYLPDLELLRRCRAAAVPLCAHTHISASGSIGSWIAAGRRPLVADSRYAAEIDALRPGTITRYAPATLAQALARALADPASTWLASGTDTRPHLLDAARAYVAWWKGSG